MEKPAPPAGFTDSELLAFEQAHPTASGEKNDLIRARGITPVRYYQRLNQLIDDPAARAEYPAMLARLSRMRRI